MNQVIYQLKRSSGKFAFMSIDKNCNTKIQHSYFKVAEKSVQTGCKVKCIPLDSPEEAEEWATGL